MTVNEGKYRDTRYLEGDVVEIENPREELNGEEFAAEYGIVEEILDAGSASPTYVVTAIDSLGNIIKGEFKAADLILVKDWNLETMILLENDMQVRVSQESYSFYEDLGATFYEADGTGVNGESEWIVFRSRDQAKTAAEEKIKQDLKQEPEIFSGEFIQENTYITQTDKRIISQEEAEARIENLGLEELKDLADRYDVDWKRDPEYSEDANRDTKRRILHEQVSVALSENIKDRLQNPVQYFVEDKGIYTIDQLYDQDFIEIDEEGAAETIVRLDGAGHILDVYDGRAVELENGAVAYATN